VPVIPFTVATGDEKYPELEKIFKELEKYGELYKIDAVKLAKDAGDIVTKNVVMLGALAGADILPFKSDFLLDAILESVPKKYIDINKKAFELGFKSIKK
jgi:indolepyruvate ferredoxin oxidoreductase beta subunit